MAKQQRKFKDRLFVFIFGRNDTDSKRWRLELYNALNETNYKDPDALKLNTIENVIYISMHNDVSFIIDNEINLFEQQSTFNPNMPLRGLLYFSQIYNAHLKKQNETLFSNRQIKIPRPKYIVFYNGKKETEDVFKMRLSDAFENNPDPGDFEWTATVLNVNFGRNKILQKKCKALYDYSSFINRTRQNILKGMSRNEAFEDAVQYAIERNFLNGLFKKYRAEVIEMLLTEYDEDLIQKSFYKDGLADGITQGKEEAKIETAENLLKMNIISVEQISQASGLTVEKVIELQKSIEVNS